MTSQSMSMRQVPAINGASLWHHALKSGRLGDLSTRAFKVLSALLFEVYADDWSMNRPITHTGRDNLAHVLKMDHSTIQRGLRDLEDAGYVTRIFNRVKHAVGVDLSPMVTMFDDLLSESLEEQERRRVVREERQVEREVRLAEEQTVRQKNLAQAELPNQVGKPAHLNTNRFSESNNSTGTGRNGVASRETAHRSQTPCPIDNPDIEALAAETPLQFEIVRQKLYEVHPRFKAIAADNTESHDATKATLKDLMAALDVLRDDIGFRWTDIEVARRVHGDLRTLVFFVTMSSPAAVHFHEIRSVQAYIIGGLAKKPAEFCPFASMWGLYKFMKETNALDGVSGDEERKDQMASALLRDDSAATPAGQVERSRLEKQRLDEENEAFRAEHGDAFDSWNALPFHSRPAFHVYCDRIKRGLEVG